MQFIETSSITIHADEVWARCFVDVFSCRPFDAGGRGGDRRRALRRHAHRHGARAMTEIVPGARRAGGGGRASPTRFRISATPHAARTRPHRGTWLIWGVLAVVVCLSQRADGASWSLIMVAAQAALTSVIFLLAIRRGEGGVSPIELAMIALAGAGVIGWIVVDEPIVATACVVAADLVGAAMMVPKTYRDPDSETLVTFAFASVAGALAAGAVGTLDLSLLLYPIYFCLGQRRARAPDPPAPAGGGMSEIWSNTDYPYMCLKDEARTFAFRDAIRAVVRPGGRRRRRRRRQRDPVLLRGRGGRRAGLRRRDRPGLRGGAASQHRAQPRGRGPRPRRRGRRGGRRRCRAPPTSSWPRSSRRACSTSSRCPCSTPCAAAASSPRGPGSSRRGYETTLQLVDGRPPLLRIRDRGAQARVAVLRRGRAGTRRR